MTEFLNSELAKLLQLGFNGFGYLLAVIAAFLIWSNRGIALSSDYRNLLYAFMGLALVLCLTSAYLQLQQKLEFKWEKVGTGDITDNDILTPTAGDEPLESNCNYQNLGIATICWPGNPARPCQAKSMFYTQITGKTGTAKDGIVFRCIAKIAAK